MSEETMPAWANATAGAGAAVFANALVYPLDFAKTRLQVHDEHDASDKARTIKANATSIMREVMDKHGLEGLYRGMASSLAGTASTAFAYFYWYKVVRSYWTHRVSRGLGTLEELTLGALAGVAAQLCTIPVSVCTTRQQTSDHPLSFLDAVREIVDADGWKGLYTGLKPSIILCTNPAITYGLFSRIESIVLKRKPRTGSYTHSLTPGEAFFVGALAKSIATVVTYPYIMAKVRMQSKPKETLPGSRQPAPSAIDILRDIFRRKGFRAMYTGMTTQITKAVLTQAILFYMREVFTRYTLLLLLLLRRRFAIKQA